jgi:hypothetical protein
VKRSQVHITLPLDLLGQFETFMRVEQIDSPAEGARMLMRIALSNLPQAAAELATRQAAHNQTRVWALRNLQQYFYEQAKLIEMSLK